MAGGFDRVLQLKLVTDVGNINSQLAGVSGKVKGLGSTIASSLKLGAIGLAADAVVELGAAVTGGMQDAKDADAAMLNLRSTIANVGVDADTAQQKVADLSAQALDLGFDDTDATKAFDAFLVKTGSVEESAALVEASFDTARAKGVDLATAAGEVETIYNGSAKALKDYGLAGVSGMEAVDAAMLTSQGKAAAWAADSNNQLTIVQGKAGEVFEGLGTAVNEGVAAVVPVITNDLIPALTGIWETVQPALQSLGEALGPKLTEIVNKLKLLFDTILPHVQTFIDLVQPLIDTWVVNFGLAMDLIGGALDLVIALLNGDFTGAWQALTGMVDTVVESIKNTIGGIADFVLGLVPGVLTAAQGVGNAILTGILGLLSGLADGIIAPVRQALNAIVDLWNGFGIHIPEIVIFEQLGRRDTVGPINLDFPDLPHLAAGGIVMRPTRALIGEAGPEAVIPLGRSGLGATYNIDVHVAPLTDPYQVGQSIVRAIHAYERRDGKGWRR